MIAIALFFFFFMGSAEFLHAQSFERVRIAYSPGGMISLPLIIAKEKRVFQTEGLDVEMITMRPELGVKAVMSGDLQYNYFAGTTINAAVHGLPVKVVMVTNDCPLYSLMARPEIKSLKDLRGKRLGVASLTAGEAFLSRRLLKDAGIDADRDMNIIVVGNTPERINALKMGVVDATTVSVPVDFHAEQLGLKRLVFIGDVLEAISGGMGVATRMIREQPVRIKRMIRSLMKAMAYGKAHRDEMISLLTVKWPLLDRERATKTWDLAARTFDEDGIASDSAVLLSIQGALEMVREKRQVPISQVADFSIAKQAFEELSKGK
ncbi:MAG TPA: ABC transporter substrate-binding protein [Candidatus Binatia bacterium]|jgi:NitT/TauT family transport system substrate-binding protein